MVEYCFMSHKLIDGYVETDDDNDDEMTETRPALHFKDKAEI